MTREVVYKNDEGGKLVGIYRGEEHEKCVILCHGLFSDKDSNTLFSTMARSLDHKNVGSFRFDFSGCGESNESPLSIKTMRKDLAKTVQIINVNNDKEVFVLGHSLGGQVALAQKEHEKILLAPYLHKDKERITYLKKELGNNAEKRVENKFGKSFRITRSFIQEMSAITLKESLRQINNKTTIIKAKKDKIISDRIYKRILTSKKGFINVKEINTNHFFTTSRKKLFKEISSLILN